MRFSDVVLGAFVVALIAIALHLFLFGVTSLIGWLS